MKRRNIFRLFVVVLFGFSLIYSSPWSYSQEVITAKFAHVAPPGHPWTPTGEKFINIVETQSNGRIKIKYFPSGSLGSEYSNIEGIKMGQVDFTIVASPQIAQYASIWQVLEGPYLFRDRAHAYRVLDGAIGKELIDIAAQKDVMVLAYWEIGMAQTINNKRLVNRVADMKGLKLRVMSSKILMESMAVLGAIPTPMAYTEVYSALQQGVIDGEQNPTTTLESGKRHEVCKYLTMNDQYYACAPLIVNSKWMGKLSPDLKKIVMDAAAEGSIWIRKYVEEQEKVALDKLLKAGVKASYPDKKEFIEATLPVYKKIGDVVPAEFVERIRSVK